MATRLGVVTVDYFEQAERDLRAGPEMRDAMQRLCDDVAADARMDAPVAEPVSRGGAASIRGETVLTPDGWEGRVSWDRTHWYMKFPELGTVHMPARPFLRPAIARRRLT